MEQNLDGLRITGQHHNIGQSAIEGLGGLVGSLAQLIVVQCLLQQVHDLGGKLGIGQRECLGINFLSLQRLGYLLKFTSLDANVDALTILACLLYTFTGKKCFKMQPLRLLLH